MCAGGRGVPPRLRLHCPQPRSVPCRAETPGVGRAPCTHRAPAAGLRAGAARARRCGGAAPGSGGRGSGAAPAPRRNFRADATPSPSNLAGKRRDPSPSREKRTDPHRAAANFGNAGKGRVVRAGAGGPGLKRLRGAAIQDPGAVRCGAEAAGRGAGQRRGGGCAFGPGEQVVERGYGVVWGAGGNGMRFLPGFSGEWGGLRVWFLFLPFFFFLIIIGHRGKR